MVRNALAALAVAALLSGCSSSGDSGTGFQMVQFLESGKDNLPRNRILTFTFSAPVQEGQDFAERLKIQNVQVTSTGSNFARAIGEYLVSGERVVFAPRLPRTMDYSDAGFREFGSYVVFLKAGSDSIVSQAGEVMGSQLELHFETNDRFEDILPGDPPRALGLVAIDSTTGETTNLSRLDPDPDVLAAIPNDKLLNPDDASNARVIDPGAGGPPKYSTPWQLDLMISEPLDPQTVTPANVELLEIFGDALNTNNTADEDSFGTPNISPFRVPINVEIVQKFTPDGVDVRVRVTPQMTLVDDARYRLVFFGTIMGIDDRQKFVGDNGLTGDALEIVEPGGQGYTTEFLVFDRPSIASSRTVLYDPLQDQINPEQGQTTDVEMDGEDLLNTALYNSVTPPGQPEKAVGFLSAFGDGSDGDFAVSGGNTVILDTGDEANDEFEQPFSVFDVDVNSAYSNTGSPSSGNVTWDSRMPRAWSFATLTISSSSTLRVIGMNPARLRVTGLVTINGILDGSGSDGSLNGHGGAAGAAGFDGGAGGNGGQLCPFNSGECSSFDSYLDGCAPAKASHPRTLKGEGPGRGQEGGETYLRNRINHLNTITATGGGGGGHATDGEDGEDRANVGGADGTAGPACSADWNVPNSSVIGVRGVGGSSYGDREVLFNLTGGSGGGGGGCINQHQFAGTAGAGAGGGGGGGVVEIISAGPINAIGGQMSVAGGDGGNGRIVNMGRTGWDQASGGGGGGAGGSLVLISGAGIDMSGGSVDAAGGAGGARGNVGTTISCSKCNAGGDGGKGFIFLMDPDGNIPGLPNGTRGDHDTSDGILTVRKFDGARFKSITAITELFHVRAPDPTFTPMSPADISALVADDQTIEVWLTSARADIQDPLIPDIGSEAPEFLIAEITRNGNLVKVEIKNDMSGLNPDGGNPVRDAFVRVQAKFFYGDLTEAALGPYAQIGRVKISFTFN